MNRRPAVLLALATALGAPRPAPASESGAVYRYDVTYAPGDERLAVEFAALDAGGVVARAGVAGAPRRLRLCVMMAGAGRFLRDPIAGDHGVPMRISSDDDDCVEATLPRGSALRARYAVALGEMAEQGDLDRAARVPGAVIFSDKATLLRPDPTSPRGDVEVLLRLPERMTAAAPWSALGGGHHRLSVDELDGGGYVAIGSLRPLAEVPVRGGAFQPVLIESPHRAGDEDLRAWIAWAGEAVADFYLGLPRPRVLVLLSAAAGERTPGVFGAVLRHSPHPSIVLRFGAEAAGADFTDDWVAPHELFHLGNPIVEGRIPWFIEGFTTYYQDVLRGRADPRRAAAMWADLADGFGRHCDRRDDGTGALSVESRALSSRRHYARVYWGGACVAFQVDVAVRRRSSNRASLDTVLRALRDESWRHPLDERALIARLERAAGAGLVRRALAGGARAPLPALYRRLGIAHTGAGVELRDDAPEAGLRRAILPGLPGPAPADGTHPRPR